MFWRKIPNSKNCKLEKFLTKGNPFRLNNVNFKIFLFLLFSKLATKKAFARSNRALATAGIYRTICNFSSSECLLFSWYSSKGYPCIFIIKRLFLRIPTAGIVSWILIILGNIGIMIWLGTAKGVTTIQSSYAALSGPEYVAYWNLYYQVSYWYVIIDPSVRFVILLAAVYE